MANAARDWQRNIRTWLDEPAVVDELDRAIADHPQLARRFRALLEDRRPGSKALLPGSLREARDGRSVPLAERRVPRHERGDVTHDAYERKPPARLRVFRRPNRSDRGWRREPVRLPSGPCRASAH